MGTWLIDEGDLELALEVDRRSIDTSSGDSARLLRLGKKSEQ